MTLDPHPKIVTGRSWRDLPDAPPEVDVPERGVQEREIQQGGRQAGGVPPADVARHETLPQVSTSPTQAETTLENPTPALVSPPVSQPVVPSPPRAPRRTPARRRLWPAGIAAVVLLLVVAVVAWSPWDDPVVAAPEGTVGAPATADPDTGADDPAVVAAAARLLPSVVQIERLGGVGSGFVYASGGRILTAAHVVGGAGEVTVRASDGTELVGRVLGVDLGADVAVVAVDAEPEPAPLALGRDPQVGQMAIAIGVPPGSGQTASAGIVSGFENDLGAPGRGFSRLIETDIPIAPEVSGGPLADRSGEVIGINLAIAGQLRRTIPEGSGAEADGGFAIPIEQAVEIAERFVDDGLPMVPPGGDSADDESPDPDGRDSDGTDLDGTGRDDLGSDDLGSDVPGGILPPELRGLLDDLLWDEFSWDQFLWEGYGGPGDILPDGAGDFFDEFFGVDPSFGLGAGAPRLAESPPGLSDSYDGFPLEEG